MLQRKQPENVNKKFATILEKSKRAWLSAADLLFLLDNTRDKPKIWCTKLPHKPPSGALFIVNRKTFPSIHAWKIDGYEWKKRQNASNPREDRTRIRIGSDPRISVGTAHAQNIENFRRRNYMDLADAEKNIIIVHYLELKRDTFVPHDSSCTCLSCGEKEILPSPIKVAVASVPPQTKVKFETGVTLRGKFAVIDYSPKTTHTIGGETCIVCLKHKNGNPIVFGDIPDTTLISIKYGPMLFPGHQIAPGVIRFYTPSFKAASTVHVKILLNGVECVTPSQKIPVRVQVVQLQDETLDGQPTTAWLPAPPKAFVRVKRKTINSPQESKMDSFLSAGCDDIAVDAMEDDELSELSEVLLERVVRLLVDLASEEKGLETEVDALDENGFNLLHYTTMYAHPKLVRTLLEYGADPNKCTGSNDTPLHLAAESGNEEIVELLLKKGCDPTLRDPIGQLPSQIAYQYGHNTLAMKLTKVDGGKLSITEESEEGMVVESVPVSPLSVVDSLSSFDDDDVCSQTHDKHVKLLRDALGQMSLKDKCALSLSVWDLEGISTTNGTQHSDADDVRSIVSENEQSVRAAISAMGEDERQELAQEASVIQSNFRRWMLRKNFQDVRHATRKLQKFTKAYLAKRPAANRTGLNTVSNRQSPLSPQLNLNQQKPNVVSRKQFDLLKRQVSASLVIQKNVREHLQRKKNFDRVDLIKSPNLELSANKKYKPIKRRMSRNNMRHCLRSNTISDLSKVFENEPIIETTRIRSTSTPSEFADNFDIDSILGEEYTQSSNGNLQSSSFASLAQASSSLLVENEQNTMFQKQTDNSMEDDVFMSLIELEDQNSQMNSTKDSWIK